MHISSNTSPEISANLSVIIREGCISQRSLCIDSVRGLTLDVSSARIKDTLGHTSTPVFPVDCCLLCIFPCHANWLQISRYGINPVRSRPSGSSGARDHLPSCGLLWYPVIFHAQHMSQPSQFLSLMMRSILCSFVWFRMSSLRTLSFHVIPKSRRWNLWAMGQGAMGLNKKTTHSLILLTYLLTVTSDVTCQCICRCLCQGNHCPPFSAACDVDLENIHKLLFIINYCTEKCNLRKRCISLLSTKKCKS